MGGVMLRLEEMSGVRVSEENALGVVGRDDGDLDLLRLQIRADHRLQRQNRRLQKKHHIKDKKER